MIIRASMIIRLVVVLVGVAVMVLGSVSPASAHPLSTSAVLLDLESDRVTATVELPLDQLGVALDEELTPTTVLDEAHLPALRDYAEAHLSATDDSGQSWTTTVAGGRVEVVDGVEHLVLDATLVPRSGHVGDFVLHDAVIMDRLVAHRIFVSARYGSTGTYTTLAMLSWQRQDVPVARVAQATSPAASPGFVGAISLGAHHIAGGSDHLLFLIMLMLPAPLLAGRRRWVRPDETGRRAVARTGRRVVHVVTAFTVGHSVTLALGALGWVHLPSRLVECGIAVSVLISAVHAVRPLVRRGEVVIAGTFGLLHGLAFASVLSGLELGPAELVTTLLGFNLGIELTQLLVVALVAPSLILLSRTRAYPVLRTGVAAVGVVLAAGWIAARAGMLAADPVEPVADLLVDHPFVLAFTLGGLALVLSRLPRIGRRGPVGPKDPTKLGWPRSLTGGTLGS